MTIQMLMWRVLLPGLQASWGRGDSQVIFEEILECVGVFLHSCLRQLWRDGRILEEVASGNEIEIRCGAEV